MENFWRELAILFLWFIGVVFGYVLIEVLVLHMSHF